MRNNRNLPKTIHFSISEKLNKNEFAYMQLNINEDKNVKVVCNGDKEKIIDKAKKYTKDLISVKAEVLIVYDKNTY